LSVALVASGAASAAQGINRAAGQPLDLIVQYRSASAASMAVVNARTIKSLDHIRPGKQILKFGSEAALQQGMAQLRANPDVLYVDRAHGVAAQIDKNYSVEIEKDVVDQFVPNDPLFGQQWDKIIQHAPAAWDNETGKSNVILVISDTGSDCTTLPDLAPNCRQDLSRNFITDPVENWHGYHVAGIAAAAINNGIDIAGTAGTAKIAMVRFLDHNGQGADSDGLLTWNYALQLAGQVCGSAPCFKVVVNNSWGSNIAPTQSYIDAAAALKAAGVAVVAAAGNNGTDNCTTPFMPAVLADVVGVAATDSNDKLASFSNFGSCQEASGGVFIAAPGVNVLSLDHDAGGTATRLASGTSMASPQVAGAWALAWSQDPTLSIQAVKDRMEIGSPNLGFPVFTKARVDLPGMVHAAAPSIRLSLALPTTEVNQNSAIAGTVSLRGLGGFAGPAALDCSGVTAASCVVNPTSITPGQPASVTLMPSLSTPAPQAYNMVIHAAASSDSTIQDTTQAQVMVWPYGTKDLRYVSTQSAHLGGVFPFFTAPPPVSTVITAPDDGKIYSGLSGVVHLTYFPTNSLTASLIAPNGTTFPIPLPFNANPHNDVPFQTHAFDGTPVVGNWIMKVQVPAGPNGQFQGSLDGWEIDAKSVPATPPPPPPPPVTVDFPAISFDWASTNATGCTASGAWSGTEPTTGTMRFAEPFAGTYTLTCGSNQRSLTIGVQ
jgi:thermitase